MYARWTTRRVDALGDTYELSELLPVQVGDIRDGARRTHKNVWKELTGQDNVERRRGARTTGDDRFEADDRVGGGMLAESPPVEMRSSAANVEKKRATGIIG